MKQVLRRSRGLSSFRLGCFAASPILPAAMLACLIAFLTVMDRAAAAEFASVYTRHDFRTCAEQSSPEPGIVEVRVCAGYAGTPLTWTGEPDTGTVSFGRSADGRGRIPGLDAFHEARGTVEWRGPKVGGRVEPVAAILRYDTGPAIGRLASSRLVVYRLAPRRRSCVMGVVDGASSAANAAARAMIDRRAPGFVCGRSRAVPGG